jgi:hypothetical protein
MHFGWRVAGTDHSSKLQYLTRTKVGEKEVFVNVKINATLVIKLLIDRGLQAGTNSILQNGPRWQIFTRKWSLESLMSVLLKPGKTKLGTSSKHWISCGYTMLHQKPQNLCTPSEYWKNLAHLLGIVKTWQNRNLTCLSSYWQKLAKKKPTPSYYWQNMSQPKSSLHGIGETWYAFPIWAKPKPALPIFWKIWQNQNLACVLHASKT